MVTLDLILEGKWCLGTMVMLVLILEGAVRLGVVPRGVGEKEGRV